MEVILFFLFLSYGIVYEWGKQGSFKGAIGAIFDV